MSSVDLSLSLGEGGSPLLELSRLGKALDLPRIWAKNEIFNPTASFKDRGTVVAVHMAKAWGHDKIGTVSTGNMAISTAAYGARSGLLTYVFVKEDTSTEKLISAGVHGAVLIRVRGDYGRLSLLSFEMGKKYGIYIMNSTDPFRLEGYKVTGFEIFDQMRAIPDYVIVPVSSGGHLIGLIKAFTELIREGLIDRLPTFIGVQAEGCSPIAQAFTKGRERCERIGRADSIAQSITNPDPPGGNVTLKLIRDLGGEIIAADDQEILAAQKKLAEVEGIFCLPASATVLAGVLKLQARNHFRVQDRIVMVLTGSGVKNPKAIDPAQLNLHDSSLADLESLMSILS
jgi:threonine synthase